MIHDLEATGSHPFALHQVTLAQEAIAAQLKKELIEKARVRKMTFSVELFLIETFYLPNSLYTHYLPYAFSGFLLNMFPTQ